MACQFNEGNHHIANAYNKIVSDMDDRKYSLGIFLDLSLGSLLGPLLYLCYSNDIFTSVKNKMLLYADDSVIISSDTNPDVVARDLLRCCFLVLFLLLSIVFCVFCDVSRFV